MATTIKYDNTDVEAGGGGEHAQPGMYAGKIVSVTHRTAKSNGDPANDLEVVVDVGEEFRRVWTYIGLNSNTKWKMREFTDAVGLPPKGDLTPAKIKALENKKVSVKIAADTDLDGEYRAKVKNLFKPGEGGETTSASSDHQDGYDTLTMEDLIAELEERNLEIPKGRKTEAKLIAILEADDEANDSSTAVDEGKADGEPEDDYDDWTMDDLKEEIESRGATGNLPGGRMTEGKLVAFLRELDASGEPEDDANGAEPDEYDDAEIWPDSDLEDELKARNEQGADIKISGRKNRAKLIAALREDDSTAEPF